MMMMHQTDKEHEEYGRKLVPQVRGSMPNRAVCGLETGVNW